MFKFESVHDSRTQCNSNRKNHENIRRVANMNQGQEYKAERTRRETIRAPTGRSTKQRRSNFLTRSDALIGLVTL